MEKAALFRQGARINSQGSRFQKIFYTFQFVQTLHRDAAGTHSLPNGIGFGWQSFSRCLPMSLAGPLSIGDVGGFNDGLILLCSIFMGTYSAFAFTIDVIK